MYLSVVCLVTITCRSWGYEPGRCAWEGAPSGRCLAPVEHPHTEEPGRRSLSFLRKDSAILFNENPREIRVLFKVGARVTFRTGIVVLDVVCGAIALLRRVHLCVVYWGYFRRGAWWSCNFLGVIVVHILL